MRLEEFRAQYVDARGYQPLSKPARRYGQDACNVGDEGGFAVPVQDNNEALDVLMEAIKAAGHEDKVGGVRQRGICAGCGSNGEHARTWKRRCVGVGVL